MLTEIQLKIKFHPRWYNWLGDLSTEKLIFLIKASETSSSAVFNFSSTLKIKKNKVK